MVTHDLSLAAQADRIVHLKDGRLRLTAPVVRLERDWVTSDSTDWRLPAAIGMCRSTVQAGPSPRE